MNLHALAVSAIAVWLLQVERAGANTWRRGAPSISWGVRDVRDVIREEGPRSLAPRQPHVDPTLLYPAYHLSVPVDHFHNDSRYEPHSNDFFDLRFWFDASHYKPGGPVIVLQGGESAGGAGRLSLLQKGIVAQLAEATGGIGVILEHRYYGASFPVPDLSIENMRFLSTDQALADMAYFAQHIVFPGFEDVNLTASTTAYIAYGGSYAGAFVAFLRKLYPETYWGAISSSGVTEATIDFWQYFEAHRLYVAQPCVNATQILTHVIDNILIGKKGTELPRRLKAAFGLGSITRSNDFAAAISDGISGLQSINWNPAQSSDRLSRYCEAVKATDLQFPKLEKLRPEAETLVTAGGYQVETGLVNQMLNYIGFIETTAVAEWQGSGFSQDEYFTVYNEDRLQQDSLDRTQRSWSWQYCTEWGFFVTGSGVPADQLPLISRLIDVPYRSQICKAAFNIATPPRIELVNRHGGFAFSYPRVAIIDGEHDPWRAATPHAIGQPDRPNTIEQPFVLIERAVHHWDENGLFPNETTAELPPPSIKAVQKYEAEFVRAWWEEWKTEKGKGQESA